MNNFLMHRMNNVWQSISIIKLQILRLIGSIFSISNCPIYQKVSRWDCSSSSRGISIINVFKKLLSKISAFYPKIFRLILPISKKNIHSYLYNLIQLYKIHRNNGWRRSTTSPSFLQLVIAVMWGSSASTFRTQNIKNWLFIYFKNIT